MFKKLIVFINIVLFPLATGVAQDKWSLNNCISYAIENNLSHRTFVIQEENQKLSAQQAKLDLLPSVYGSTSGGYYFGRSVDASTNSYTNTEYYSTSGYLYASLYLFKGFRKINNISYSKFQLHAAHWNRINDSDDLAFEVLSAFYDVLYYNELVNISYDELKLSEIELDNAQTQVEIGLKAKADMAQMQALLEQERLNILLAENQYQEAKQYLMQTMNIAGIRNQSFVIDDFEIIPKLELNSNADSIFDAFSQYSPLIKTGESELKAAQKNVSIAQGTYMPTVKLSSYVGSSFYKTDYDDNGNTTAFADQIKNHQSKYVGASVSIPIFYQNAYRKNVKQAKLSRELAEVNLEMDKQNLYFDIEKNVRELNAKYSKYIQSKKNQEAYEYAFLVTQKKYKEGLISIIDLLSVKKQLSSAKSQLLLSRIEWEIKSKTMQFYKGARFWE